MSLNTMIPATPSGKIVNWLTLISVILVIAFIADHYWGKDDLFGIAKKKTDYYTPQTTV